MRYSSLMHAYLLVKITPVPVKLLCDLCLIITRAQNCFILFPSLHVPAPHKEASTESKTDDRRCKRSGVLARVELGKGARAKKQAQRRKQTAVGVFRCFSLSKNWYLNISAKVWAPLGNQAHRNKSSMNITVQWLATHPCKEKKDAWRGDRTRDSWVGWWTCYPMY